MSPRGIFYLSDLIAYGARRRLMERGIAVAEHVCLVGFGNNRLNDWIAPWLGSVGVAHATFGAAVVDVLRDLWSGQTAPVRVLPNRLMSRSDAFPTAAARIVVCAAQFGQPKGRR